MRSPCDLVDFLVATPCDRHGIMIKFSNCEEGKLSIVKLSRFAKIRENRESFDVYGNRSLKALSIMLA